jgi:hypothetical protein
MKNAWVLLVDGFGASKEQAADDLNYKWMLVWLRSVQFSLVSSHITVTTPTVCISVYAGCHSEEGTYLFDRIDVWLVWLKLRADKMLSLRGGMALE